MSTYAINAEQFDKFIQEKELLFIDFWAKWCAPCMQFTKIYEQVAKQNPQITFAKVNVEEEKDLSDNLQILSIPHLMVFKQGILIYSESGAMPESTLKDLVKQALEADVCEIREKLDKEG